MAITVAQKIGVLVTPVAAIWLACLLKDDAWKESRPKQSWRERAVAAAAEKEPGKPPEAPAPAGPEAPKPEAPEPARGSAKKGPEKTPPPAPPPGPAKPAEPEVPEVPFPLAAGTRLVPLRGGERLVDKADDRLDFFVGSSGMVRFGRDFKDPDGAAEMIKAEEKRETALLLLVPTPDAPWNTVRDLAKAAAAAGWKRMALGGCDSASATSLRLFRVQAPKAARKRTDVEAVRVTVGADGRFRMGELSFESPMSLQVKVRESHEENASFSKDYADTVEDTPWILDGEGATAGAVLAALDAIRAAGVGAVRLAGIGAE